MPKERIIFVFWMLLKFTLVLSLSFHPKVFKLESFVTCPDGGDKLPSRYLEVNISTPQRNLYVLNGDIIVSEDIKFPIALSLDVKRCSMDKTHCEDYDHMTMTQMCGKLRDAKALWAPMVEMIKPAPHCPIKKGTYRMVNATANLASVSRLPLDGYRWLTRFTIHPEGHPKQVNLCVDVEVSVMNQKRRQGN